MSRTIAHFLLSFVLIFQGVVAACAVGPMTCNMTKQAMAAGSVPCQGCPACPEGSKARSDCLNQCSMPAGLPSPLAIVRDVPPCDALVTAALVSLVDFVQVPPTPPPIA